MLLKSHGAVGVGHTMREALHACQLVERMAHIYVAARALDRSATLPDDVVAAEMELFRMRQQAHAGLREGTA